MIDICMKDAKTVIATLAIYNAQSFLQGMINNVRSRTSVNDATRTVCN